MSALIHFNQQNVGYDLHLETGSYDRCSSHKRGLEERSLPGFFEGCKKRFIEIFSGFSGEKCDEGALILRQWNVAEADRGVAEIEGIFKSTRNTSVAERGAGDMDVLEEVVDFFHQMDREQERQLLVKAMEATSRRARFPEGEVVVWVEAIIEVCADCENLIGWHLEERGAQIAEEICQRFRGDSVNMKMAEEIVDFAIESANPKVHFVFERVKKEYKSPVVSAGAPVGWKEYRYFKTDGKASIAQELEALWPTLLTASDKAGAVLGAFLACMLCAVSDMDALRAVLWVLFSKEPGLEEAMRESLNRALSRAYGSFRKNPLDEVMSEGEKKIRLGVFGYDLLCCLIAQYYSVKAEVFSSRPLLKGVEGSQGSSALSRERALLGKYKDKKRSFEKACG